MLLISAHQGGRYNSVLVECLAVRFAVRFAVLEVQFKVNWISNGLLGPPSEMPYEYLRNVSARRLEVAKCKP